MGWLLDIFSLILPLKTEGLWIFQNFVSLKSYRLLHIKCSQLYFFIYTCFLHIFTICIFCYSLTKCSTFLHYYELIEGEGKSTCSPPHSWHAAKRNSGCAPFTSRYFALKKSYTSSSMVIYFTENWEILHGRLCLFG